MNNRLFFGDNLEVLRESVKDGTINLVYLDPPFNSNANYNVLFKDPTGKAAEAQAEAFRDTWGWGEHASHAYEDVTRSGGDLALLMKGFRSVLHDRPIMAYLAMMAVRLAELHRCLKATGSIYLHCDPTASHYLKVVLDSIFGGENFVSEVVWRRTNARGTKGRWPRLHDTILHYAKGSDFFFEPQVAKAEKSKLPHTLITGPDGVKYQTYELTGAGKTGLGESGLPWKGQDPGKLGRHWGYSLEEREEWDEAGLIHWPKDGGFPRRRAAEPFDPESRKVVIGDVWSDIDRLNQTAKERLGYPTQKPVALLQRIIAASSREGEVVLDPFCGCGTTVEAAERMKRRWVGIDVTHYAVTLIEERLRRSHPSAAYTVHGRPTDNAGAVELARRDKHQFQWWAAWLAGAQSYREQKKGADRGIDGNIVYRNGPYGDGRIIISVKGGDNLGVAMVRDLRGVIEREEAEMGLLVTLVEPTSPMVAEAAAAGFVRKSAHGRLPRLQVVTVGDLLDGRKPQLPPLPQPDRSGYRPRKKKRVQDDQLPLLLPFAGAKLHPEKGVFTDPRFAKLGS